MWCSNELNAIPRIYEDDDVASFSIWLTSANWVLGNPACDFITAEKSPPLPQETSEGPLFHHIILCSAADTSALINNGLACKEMSLSMSRSRALTLIKSAKWYSGSDRSTLTIVCTSTMMVSHQICWNWIWRSRELGGPSRTLVCIYLHALSTSAQMSTWLF